MLLCKALSYVGVVRHMRPALADVINKLDHPQELCANPAKESAWTLPIVGKNRTYYSIAPADDRVSYIKVCTTDKPPDPAGASRGNLGRAGAALSATGIDGERG